MTKGVFGSSYVSPYIGAVTMLPALTPTYTVSRSSGDGPRRRSASPDSRIQRHRYRTSPPYTNRASVSWTAAIQYSALMLGRAVSSSTPNEFHPNSHMGLRVDPLMNRY